MENDKEWDRNNHEWRQRAIGSGVNEGLVDITNASDKEVELYTGPLETLDDSEKLRLQVGKDQKHGIFWVGLNGGTVTAQWQKGQSSPLTSDKKI